MGIVRKHSINFTLIYYLGVILGYVNTVILFPNLLEPDQFGLTRLLLAVAIIVSQFAQLGTPSMIIRYFPVLKHKVFSVGLLICSTGVVIVLGLLLLLKDPISSFYIEESKLFVDYYHLLLPLGAAIVFYNLFDAYQRAIYKNVFSTFLVNIVLRLMWMALIIFYSFGLMSFEVFIVLYAWSYALISVVSFIYIKIIDAPAIIVKYEKSEKILFKQIRSFNLYTLLAGISAFLINKVDILMLGSIENLGIVAVYSIAAYMAMVIRVPASSIARTAQSLVASSFKNDDIPTISNLYSKTSITQLILSAGVFILILVNYNNILFLIPKEFKNSYFIFLFLGLTQVIDSASGINGIIMINSKFYRYETFFSVLLLILTVCSNLILIPLMGGEGAALATLLSISIYNALRLSFIWKNMKIQPFSSKTLLGIVICSVAFLVGYFIPTLNFFILDAFVRSLAVFSVIIPLVYLFKLSPDSNQMIDEIIVKIRKLIKR